MFPVFDSELLLPILLGTADEPAAPAPLDVEITDLFALLRNPLLRYLAALGLPEHDGEEIIQEVFLALFEHLRRGKSRRNLRGWIFRVAHNLGLKRRMKMQGEHLGEIFEQSDPALNPEEQWATTQYGERLRSVFEALPELDRCCLMLRAEGLRYREIARTLNISLGGVSLSLTRSLARLERAAAR